jgi:TRAP transporter TAXI family solute receptor
MKRRALLAGLAAVTVSGAAACRPGHKSVNGFDTTPIVLAAGSTVGVYYQYATAIAELARDDLGVIDVKSTTGSVDNLHRLSIGTATLAFSAADAATAAFSGNGNADGPIPVRAIAKLYDDYIHLVVPSDSKVTALADLRGRRVSVGAAGSGTALIADRLLFCADIDPHRAIDRKQLSLDASVTALDAGAVDAFFWSGGLPTVAVAALAQLRPIRLLDLRVAASRLRDLFGTCYRIGAIPGNTYPDQSKPVPTLAVPNLLVTLARQPDEGVYRTAEFIFGNAARLGTRVPVAAELDRHTALFTEPIPLHGGALAFYRADQPQ